MNCENLQGKCLTVSLPFSTSVQGIIKSMASLWGDSETVRLCRMVQFNQNRTIMHNNIPKIGKNGTQ